MEKENAELKKRLIHFNEVIQMVIIIKKDTKSK